MDRRAIGRLATELVDMLDPDVLSDLRLEDPGAAIEVHFEPVRVVELPMSSLNSSDCSVDGYYESTLDPRRPAILFEPDVSEARVRFTVLHELGHHLVNTIACEMLDLLDEIGRSASGAQQAEEQLCHQFAAQVLIPDQLLAECIGDRPLHPTDVLAVYLQSSASWEAVAVRTAAFDGRAAVVLVRSEGSISFAATGGGRWSWPRNSTVEPDGPLSRALRSNARPRADTWRYGLAYAERMFCETTMVDRSLAVGVMRGERVDGQFDFLEQPEPIWKDREEWCYWCDEERDEGWCETCRGRHCHDCGRCGCSQPRPESRA